MFEEIVCIIGEELFLTIAVSLLNSRVRKIKR
jgi:hypothetical protein